MAEEEAPKPTTPVDAAASDAPAAAPPPPPEIQQQQQQQHHHFAVEEAHPHNQWVSLWFKDLAEPLANQSLCTRLMCFPCQCGEACVHSACRGDCCGVMSVLCCCPCRTFCVLFPTAGEKGNPIPQEPQEFPYEPAAEEGEEITYERVFEMELKKRKLLNAEIH